MTQLRRAKGDDHHLFIRAGRSKGIRQITEAGETWLRQQKYIFPRSGGWVKLDLSDYRYLDNHEYLYTKGEEYTSIPTLKPSLPLLPREMVHYGPPLLLQLADNHHPILNTEVEWTLVLKLDEWEEGARNALLQNGAVEVGCYADLEGTAAYTFSSINLQQILNADYWPEVAPQAEAYKLYWQNQNSEQYQEDSRVTKLLDKATPTLGLKTGWQGNVFFKFIDGGLENTWKRYLPGMSISRRDCNECYWLAQSGQETKSTWPGKTQRIGQAKRDWQLWHLQIDQETDIEDVTEWFWYRQIRLMYSTCRLSLLNPLSIISKQEYTCIRDQALLVCCDPPALQAENGPISAFISLVPYTKSTLVQFPGSPVQSPSFRVNSGIEYYLRAPAPPANQKYRLSVGGEVQKSQSTWVQTSPLPAQLPSWLHGLCCSVVIANKQHTVKAFSHELGSQPYTHQLSVATDFSLAQLGEATWSYQPSGLPCSLRWEYLSAQGERCEARSGSIETDTALTRLWQTSIWPTVNDSPWVTLTLDAASFGSIHLKLVLQADTAQQVWWENPHAIAPFFWLSRIVEQEAVLGEQRTFPELSQVLEQLCVSDMPAALKNALARLASSRNMPVWVYMHLQVLLAKLPATLE